MYDAGRVVAPDQTPLVTVVLQAVSESPPFVLTTNELLGEYFRLPAQTQTFPNLPADTAPAATNRVRQMNIGSSGATLAVC